MPAMTRASCSPKASICRGEAGRGVGRGGARGGGGRGRRRGAAAARRRQRRARGAAQVAQRRRDERARCAMRGARAGGRGVRARLLAEGRLLLVLLGLGHVGLDLADLGAHAGRGDDADGRAVGDRRAREHHVELALDARILRDELEVLEHGLALPRERALVRLEGGRLELHDAHVSRHLVAHADVDHVARHELRRRHVGHDLAVAQHPRGGRLHLLECLERVLGVVLLPDADDGVDDQDEHDHERLDEGLQALIALALEEGKHLPAGKSGAEGLREKQSSRPCTTAMGRACTGADRADGRTKESVAAPSRILTSRSSNCCSTSFQRGVPSSLSSSLVPYSARSLVTCASVRPLDRSVLNDLSTCASDSAHGAAWVSGVGQNISAAGTARAVSSTVRHAGWLAIAHTAAGRPPEGQTAT